MEMLIQRRNTMSFQRCITTFKQPFIDVIYGCSDVDTTLPRRRNETLEQRRVSTSYQHFYRDVIPTSELNVETTSLCLLGNHVNMATRHYLEFFMTFYSLYGYKSLA